MIWVCLQDWEKEDDGEDEGWAEGFWRGGGCFSADVVNWGFLVFVWVFVIFGAKLNFWEVIFYCEGWVVEKLEMDGGVLEIHFRENLKAKWFISVKDKHHWK